MKYEYVTYEVTEDGVAVVTIDRPPVNAMCSEAYGELQQIFFDLGQDDAVRGVIITAKHPKIFIGGSDVTEFLKMDGSTGLRYSLRNNSVRWDVYTFPKPVICALNGSAIGGGLGLAIMCDMRISVPHAKFGVGEINMGVLGFTQYLSALCHNGTARKMVYGGIQIPAEEALRVGLIDEIVEPEELMPRALELMRNFIGKSPLALRAAKRCMLKAQSDLIQYQGFEDQEMVALWASEDSKEAVHSFLEKRKPDFQGK